MSDNSWLNGISVDELLEWPEMADVKQELNDARFGTRAHGSRATYAEGCHGPLCRTVEKHRARLRNQVRAFRAGREYEEGGKKGREYDRDDLLLALVEWHKLQLAVERRARRTAS